MIQVICDCEKPIIDGRLKYGYLTTSENPKPKRMLNPIQHCKKCGGIIQKDLDKEIVNVVDEKFWDLI